MDIADFNVKITEDNGKFTIVLVAQGDDFEVEVYDPKDLIDEVDELIQDRLTQYGISFRDS
jgi:hypothetical protein